MAFLMISLSAIYAVLVAYDSGVASAIALGYVAVLLTVFLASNVRKKP